MDNIEKLRNAIHESTRICVFTGAGISCPSGIPDFRSAGGLYSGGAHGRYMPEEILSHSFFMSHPDLFYEFHKSKMLYPEAGPNEAHLFFAGLEKAGKKVMVVTQNIDGLHQAAGSGDVVELHGSAHRNLCMKCGKNHNMRYVIDSDGVPFCECGGMIKPDVVLYEEPLKEEDIDRAVKGIEEAELMVVAGTSLTVYPAAGFVKLFRGKTLALINKASTEYDGKADIVISGDIVQVVRLLGNIG